MACQLILHLHLHSSNDPAIVGFNVHPPIAWIETLLKGIGSIPAFTAAGDVERDFVDQDERLTYVRTIVPVMVYRGPERDWRKDGRETIDRLVRCERRIRPLPDFIPFSLV